MPRPPTPHASGATPPALPREALPRHVAVVMDGNGRWAKQRGLSRTKGHEQGEHSLFDTVEGAIELGVPFLRRWIMWAAVRLGALANPAGREKWWTQAWRVALIAVIALAVGWWVDHRQAARARSEIESLKEKLADVELRRELLRSALEQYPGLKSAP